MVRSEFTHRLYDQLQQRVPPEVVAETIFAGLSGLDKAERKTLKAAAKARLFSGWWMPSDFKRPESHLDRQLALLPLLFEVSSPPVVPELRDKLGMGPAGQKSKRLTKKQRQALGIYKTARWYNKRRRLLDRVDEKSSRLRAAEELYLFTRVSKAGLSVEIPFESFSKDENTAALVTYLAARMNRRSVFTNKPQDRAYDSVAKMLMKRCRKSGTTDWFLVAHLLPDEEVLKRLSDEQKGYLLGRWHSLLVSMAERLRECWDPGIDREKMIVSRGNDSSTWNAVAGAWNKAREHWVSLTHEISGEEILEKLCPGKVMRLMAADVFFWHRSSGGSVHPDTKVFAELPLPWEVLRGEKKCGLKEIRESCERHGANPKSWGPRSGREAVKFKPTPNLVHGVEVSSPSLAAALHKAGVFSGKIKARKLPEFSVERDEHGAALVATEDLPS